VIHGLPANVLALLAAIAGLVPLSHAAPAPRPRLWVIQGAELVEFDPRNFERLGAVAIPQEAVHNPELLAVNIGGQVLEESEERPWLWNGTSGGFVKEEPRTPHVSPGPGYALRTQRQWLLGDDGRSAYLLENDLWERKRTGEDSVYDDSTRVHFHMERYDIGTRSYSTVLTRNLAACACGTGFCPETCPIVSGWAPCGVVDTFFTLTDYVSGQLQSDHGPYIVHRRDKFGRFAPAETLDVSNCLDADGRGDVLDATEDGACCGWSNEDSEQATFFTRDSAFVLFQEWPSFHNASYDVSFTPTDGRLSPSGALAAFTIHGVGGPNDRGIIPLNSDARPDTLALIKIRRAWDDMPLVEIHDVRAHPTLVRRVRHSELVGWLTNQRVLLLENQSLVTIDVRSGERVNSQVRAENAHAVLLVRP
jgi:hypothetical protein